VGLGFILQASTPPAPYETGLLSQVCMTSRGSYQGGDRVESFPPLLRHRLVVIS
jgi:hypothetical protein